MPTTLTELAEHWHAPDCTIDAGGGCILHAEEKEAWIAGYESSARERDELRAEVERLTRINNQAIERMRIAESHKEAEQERRKDAEAAATTLEWQLSEATKAAERLRTALRQILEDPDARILDSHRDDGWEALGVKQQGPNDHRAEDKMEYRKYRRSQIAELADWTPDVDMEGVSISFPDKQSGSPKEGDKIARNPANHADRWLVCAAYFEANFELA